MCSACRHYEHRGDVDWDARRRELDAGARSLPVARRLRVRLHHRRERRQGLDHAGDPDARARHEPAVRDRDDRRALRHRPAQHREPEVARRRLHRVHDEPDRAPPHQQARAVPGRRHLVARARDDLHAARAPRGADGHQAHRVGRELAERVRRPGRGRDRQHAHAALARGVRRAARPARQRSRGPGRHRSEAPRAVHVSRRRGPRARRRDRHLPRLLHAVGRPAERDLRPVVRLRDVAEHDRGLVVQLREPRQPPDGHSRLLQVHQVRLRPRDRHRVDARAPRSPAAAPTRSSS